MSDLKNIGKNTMNIKSCPKCNEGEMIFTGASIDMLPPLNLHRCNKCKHEDYYIGEKFPKINSISNSL